MLKKTLKNQKGFTLIEIIAVLVILGILAAVAVPKYMDLQSDAKVKSIQGAVAAAGSNVYMAYSKSIMSNPTMTSSGRITDILAQLNTANANNVGDFVVSYTGSGTNGIIVNVTQGPVGGSPNASYLTGLTLTNINPKTVVLTE